MSYPSLVLIILGSLLVVNPSYGLTDYFSPQRHCALSIVDGYSGTGFVMFSYANSYRLRAGEVDGASCDDNYPLTQDWRRRLCVQLDVPFGTVLTHLEEETQKYETVKLFERCLSGRLSEEQRLIAISELNQRLSDGKSGAEARTFLRNTLYGHFNWEQEIELRQNALPLVPTNLLLFNAHVARLMHELDDDRDQILRAHHVFVNADPRYFTTRRNLPVNIRNYYRRELAEMGFFWNLIHNLDSSEEWLGETRENETLNKIFPHHAEFVDQLVASYRESLTTVSSGALDWTYRPLRNH